MRGSAHRERKIINALLVVCVTAGFACFALFALPDQLEKARAEGGAPSSPRAPANISSIVAIGSAGTPSSEPSIKLELRGVATVSRTREGEAAEGGALPAAPDPSTDDLVAGGAGAAIDDMGSEATEALAYGGSSSLNPESAAGGRSSELTPLSSGDKPAFKAHARSSLALRQAARDGTGRASWLAVPEELGPEFRFWRDIYAKYDKSKVVLHHPRHLGIVYEVVNLSDIDNDPRLTDVERARMRENRVNARRADYAEALERLALGSSSGSEEEIRIKKLFENVLEEDKYKRAAEDGVRSQTGQRDKFIAGLARSGRYLGEIESLFSAYGLPRELTRLIFVESMFNLQAVSKTGASGIWQFMPATGKLYLQMNEIVDERNDPVAATHAAARLLRHNYDELGTWPLAVNAYNSGRGRMKQAVERLGTTDIAKIIREFESPGYGFASRNFFPEFLAALEVAEKADEYFGPIEHDPPLRYESVTLKHTILLPEAAKISGIELSELAELNPAITPRAASGARPIPAGFEMRVPEGKGELFLAAAARSPSSRTGPLKHLVAKEETLQAIARMYGVEPRAIVEANEGMGWRVKTGQTILVPVGTGR